MSFNDFRKEDRSFSGLLPSATGPKKTANETAGARVPGGMRNSWTGGEAAFEMEEIKENLALSVHRCEPEALERLIDRCESSMFSHQRTRMPPVNAESDSVVCTISDIGLQFRA